MHRSVLSVYSKEKPIITKPTGFMHNSGSRYRQRFLQPVAVALVFLLFGVLFFGMAMMDLNRLEALLLDALRKKALYVAEVIEKSSSEKHRRLSGGGYPSRRVYGGLAVDDEALSMQEGLAGPLIEVARHIDLLEATEADYQEKLHDLIASANLRAVALLDGRKHVVFGTGPLPSDILAFAKALVEGKEELVVQFFHGMKDEDSLGLVGVRRREGKGAVVVALDRKAVEARAWAMAIQSALEELRWGRGIVYLAVEDAHGRLLARAGNHPEEKVEACLLLASATKGSDSYNGECLRVGDTKFLELSFPFQLQQGFLGTTRVGIETQETEQLLGENRRHIFLWAGMMIMIGLSAMVVLYQTQNRHVARLQAMQERLHHAERVSSLGKLGAGVAHEIRNPLNAISMAAQRLQREFAPSDPEENTEFNGISHIIRDEVKRLNGIVEDFLSLTQNNQMEFREQPVGPLLDRVLALTREEAALKGVRIEKDCGSKVPRIHMNKGRMEQALLNIVRNAVDSITDAGVVTLSCQEKGKGWTAIAVRDTGCGIPETEQGRIFDPFYTTKKNGVGLGLAITHEIILAHGGEIRVHSEPTKGTTFEILLPAPSRAKT